MYLVDYQILALVMIGISIGAFVTLIIEDRHSHKDMSFRRYCKRLYRYMSGLDEPRVITSTNHLKH